MCPKLGGGPDCSRVLCLDTFALARQTLRRLARQLIERQPLADDARYSNTESLGIG